MKLRRFFKVCGNTIQKRKIFDGYFNAIKLGNTWYSIIRQHNPDNRDQGILTYDRVHLNDEGNELVAREMWKVLR